MLRDWEWTPCGACWFFAFWGRGTQATILLLANANKENMQFLKSCFSKSSRPFQWIVLRFDSGKHFKKTGQRDPECVPQNHQVLLPSPQVGGPVSSPGGRKSAGELGWRVSEGIECSSLHRAGDENNPGRSRYHPDTAPSSLLLMCCSTRSYKGLPENLVPGNVRIYSSCAGP